MAEQNVWLLYEWVFGDLSSDEFDLDMSTDYAQVGCINVYASLDDAQRAHPALNWQTYGPDDFRVCAPEEQVLYEIQRRDVLETAPA